MCQFADDKKQQQEVAAGKHNAPPKKNNDPIPNYGMELAAPPRVCVCDAVLPSGSRTFHHSLVLTSTAEPRGTFTTDLASHFQCSNGRPLLSVSTAPSSF